MGRPPKPAALRAPGPDPQHKANGTLVPRAPAQVRKRGDPAPEPPEGLGARGEIEWTRIWGEGFWLEPEADYHWVLMIAQAYDDIAAFREEIANTGLLVSGYKQDMIVANPLLKEVRTAQNMIMKALSVLGFSPTDRARLGIQEAQARSALLDLQSKMRENK